MEVEADKVFVIPPDALLTIEHGHLHLQRPEEPRGRRSPVDRFFTSLAHDQGGRIACVVLSGTGSDGTQGLRAVKEAGGLTLAQAGVEYDGMVRSALATGLVDFVLPVEEIPKKLVDYFRHLDQSAATAVPLTNTELLAQLCNLLRSRTGHDFKDYKDKTFFRRVQRRMQVLQLESIPAFIERLRREPREIDLLFQDLLIGVTSFFRDPAAFAALEAEVIPRLFEKKSADDSVRVWVPGCSTGEEAYSIAMLLREHMPKTGAAPKLQIFASDIDEHALETARVGRYPNSIAKDVPPQRLERFFVREDGTYRVASDLREICLFSLHNLLRDAPFSKLDLVSCRNLLIYLNSDLQNRVIPLFHYALRDEGFLFLGTSENVTRHTRLFSTVDKTHRIFRRRPLATRSLPEFPLTAPDAGRRRPMLPLRPVLGENSAQAVAERQLLENYAPAYVVINADGEVMCSSGRTGKYLELPPGVPDHNIFSMARRGLRLELRAALHKAIATGQVATQGSIAIGTNGGRQIVDLYVHPLPGSNAPADALYMVVFQDVGGLKLVSDQESPPADEEDVATSNLRQLEMELRATQERLQTTTEELESSNEELKSSNEELSSMNEELQSANEELETSREELQSINEELHTVNAELTGRVEELSRANSDMANLLESTQIATLFLDRNLCVKSFTPATKDVFRLVESDTGRPITHVRARFHPDTVQDDAERVLRTLSTIEKEVVGTDVEAHYVMRVLPYRTTDNVINGVVVTFTDVTRITAAEARIDELTRDLHHRVESLETLLDIVPVGIYIVEDSSVQANRYGVRLLGREAQFTGLGDVNMRLFAGDRELPPEEEPLQQVAASGKPVRDFESRIRCADGSMVDVMISAAPLFDEAGKSRGAIAAVTDLSARKAAERQREMLMGELQHRVKNVLSMVSALATRMLKNAPSLGQFASAFLDRLRAMGRVHELLSQRNWQGIELREIVRAAMGGQVAESDHALRLSGPEIMLRANSAATLGMVFHELSTNAVKYGALSVPAGRVEVEWNLETPERLEIAWKEIGGPEVQPAAQEGFGMAFLRRSVEYELEGAVSFDWPREGLICRIDLPLLNNVDRGSERNS
jgi:two-component system CheB/CheR fusion protein